jgi:hypothetical protein
LGYGPPDVAQAPIQLPPDEDADLAEAEAEIERGDVATPEEVRAMWAKHGLRDTADK